VPKTLAATLFNIAVIISGPYYFTANCRFKKSLAC
jgi:hypothetical protein